MSFVILNHFCQNLCFDQKQFIPDLSFVFSFSFPHGPPSLISYPSTPATIQLCTSATGSHIFCHLHVLPPSGQVSEVEGEPQGVKFPSFLSFSSSLFLFITWPPSIPLPWWWPRQAERQASLQDETHRRRSSKSRGTRRGWKWWRRKEREGPFFSLYKMWFIYYLFRTNGFLKDTLNRTVSIWEKVQEVICVYA